MITLSELHLTVKGESFYCNCVSFDCGDTRFIECTHETRIIVYKGYGHYLFDSTECCYIPQKEHYFNTETGRRMYEKDVTEVKKILEAEIIQKVLS